MIHQHPGQHRQGKQNGSLVPARELRSPDIIPGQCGQDECQYGADKQELRQHGRDKCSRQEGCQPERYGKYAGNPQNAGRNVQFAAAPPPDDDGSVAGASDDAGASPLDGYLEAAGIDPGTLDHDAGGLPPTDVLLDEVGDQTGAEGDGADQGGFDDAGLDFTVVDTDDTPPDDDPQNHGV